MQRSILSTLASATFALAALGGAAAAHAQATVRIAVGPDGPTYVEPRPYYVEPARPYYHDRYDRHDRYAQHDRRWDRNCAAPAWDPNRRYFPGQTVARNGRLFTATPVSREVYNVNSPPEWTPNYWAPTRC